MYNYDELIYYKEDVAKAYSDKRKNLTEEDAKELLRCITGYIQKQKDCETIDIPRIGELYKKKQPFSEDSVRKFTTRFTKYDEEFINVAYKKVSELDFLYEPTKVEKYYEGYSKMDLQEYQNNRSLKDK
jgi:hypothetical protein